MRLRWQQTFILGCLGVMFGVSICFAQIPPGTTTNGALDVAQIEAQISALESRTDVPAEDRETAIEVYRSALNQLLEAQKSKQGRDNLASDVQTLPSQLAEIRKTLQLPLETELESAERLAADAPLTTLEAALLQAQATEVAAANDVQRLEVALRTARERPDQIRQSLNEVKNLQTGGKN